MQAFKPKEVGAQVPESEDRKIQLIEPNQDFDRIRRLLRYVLADVNTMKAAERSAGQDIIDFGMRNPGDPAPQHVLNKLTEAVSSGASSGEYGEILIRNTLVENRHRIRQATRTVKRILWTSRDIHRGKWVQVVAGQ